MCRIDDFLWIFLEFCDAMGMVRTSPPYEQDVSALLTLCYVSPCFFNSADGIEQGACDDKGSVRILSFDKLSRQAVYRPYPTAERHVSQDLSLLNVTSRTHQHCIDDELSFLYLVGRVDLLCGRSSSGGGHDGSDNVDDDAEE
jgi:hypothetical protein